MSGSVGQCSAGIGAERGSLLLRQAIPRLYGLKCAGVALERLPLPTRQDDKPDKWEGFMRCAHRLLLGLTVGLLLWTVPAHAADLEKSGIKLAVGGKTLVAYLPLTIAERRGYFTKEGLEVEISDFRGGSKPLEALVGGSADIGCGAYEHTLRMAAKGISIKAIALQANSFGLWSASRRTRRPRIMS
jgi:hypothetical protein